jgi:CheY-like chemotaxis protein
MAKILIIDDDNDFRSMLGELLSRAAYTVIESKEGLEGLKIAELESPDLIITDIIMPHQDGIGTIMSLTKKIPGIKIIAISGGGIGQSEFYLELAKTLGAKEVFTKPIDNKEFLQAIDVLLRQ